MANGEDEYVRLDQRYRHLDREVSSLREDVASHSAILTQIQNTLEDVARTVHAPRKTEWQAILAAIGLAFTISMGALVMTTTPLQARVNELAGYHNDLHAEVMSRAEKAGEMSAYVRTMREHHEATDRVVVDLTTQIRHISERVSRIEGAAARP